MQTRAAVECLSRSIHALITGGIHALITCEIQTLEELLPGFMNEVERASHGQHWEESLILGFCTVREDDLQVRGCAAACCDVPPDGCCARTALAWVDGKHVGGWAFRNVQGPCRMWGQSTNGFLSLPQSVSLVIQWIAAAPHSAASCCAQFVCVSRRVLEQTLRDRVLRDNAGALTLRDRCKVTNLAWDATKGAVQNETPLHTPPPGACCPASCLLCFAAWSADRSALLMVCLFAAPMLLRLLAPPGVELASGEVVPVDVVLDCSGRYSRTPTWLQDAGWQQPPTKGVDGRLM